MRLLHVVHQFLPKYVGGAEVYVAGLARRQREHGHEVALFAGADQAERTAWEGFPLTTVPGGLRGPKGATALFLTTFGNATAEAAFKSVLREFRPDVVHLHQLMGLSTRLPRLAKAAGAAVCATLHDYWFLCPKSQLIDRDGGLCQGPIAGVNCAQCAAERVRAGALALAAPVAAPVFLLRQARVRRAFATCDALLAPSDYLLDTARRAGLPAARLLRVHFGLDTAPAPPHQARAEDAPLRVAYLGALDSSKGVHVLLQACRALDPAQVTVAVYGSLEAANPAYASELRALAAATPYAQSVLRGALPHEAVPAMLAATDVLVAPSLWYENAPLVIAEAFAAGVPVVASRQGALAEQVHDGVDGLLFPRGDPAALAAALNRLATEAGLLDHLRLAVPQARRTRAAHFEHMEAIYTAVVAGAPLPAAAPA